MLAGLQTKIIVAIVVMVLGGSGVIWIKHVVAERNQLRADVAVFKMNETRLKNSLKSERVAASEAVIDRAKIQRALDQLREGREGDIESQEWAATSLPAGEMIRLCAALPGMKGCE